jgi:4-hydroxyphenylpyruvate dioxygenase
MDSRVLFYRAVLGFDADATWVLPDPNGLVKSRAVTSKGHAVRIPLNVSQSRRTATARQVDTQAGAGVHHVAFSCADIFATVTALRQSGASLLDIPANYYEDLAMRFDLDEAFIAKLKSAHILYDRIGDGEFLHVYSEPFQGRFFFEFVQRINGYDQYGAANAPFRMAAFARLQRERDRELTL